MAVIALIVSFIAIRYQVLAFVQAQLAEKANQVNSYLWDKKTRSWDAGDISGIVTTILTARDLLNNHLRNKWFLLFGVNREDLIRQFALQLHSTIIVWLRESSLPHASIKTDADHDPNLKIANEDMKTELNNQFQKCKDFVGNYLNSFN